MSMTQGQALSRLRERLDEPSAAQWTDAYLRGLLNEGARDLARYTESLEATTTITVVADTASYAPPTTGCPTDVVKVDHVVFTPTSGGRQVPLDYADINQAEGPYYLGSRNEPRLFTLWLPPPSMALKLYPTPSEGGSLTVYYRKLPAELATDGSAASTVLGIEDAWVDVILDYAEARALRRDRDQRWTESMQMYETGREQMRLLTIRRANAVGQFGSWMGSHPAMLLDDWSVMP